MRVKVISDADISKFETTVNDFLINLDKRRPILHDIQYQYSEGVYTAMISYYE